jgi:hypothetical protein
MGRWDFGPEDVQASVDPAAAEPSMRFYVELPANTPVDAADELWVRIVPRGGEKMLTHAKIDLGKPGTFASRSTKPLPVEQGVIAASYNEPLPPTGYDDQAAGVSTTINEGAWAVAEPGKPANLPIAALDTSGAGGWKATSQPIPSAIVQSVEVTPIAEAPKPATLPALDSPPPPLSALATATVKRPSWSPERSGSASRRTATRPSWSATR